jgi:hypothetical protein
MVADLLMCVLEGAEGHPVHPFLVAVLLSDSVVSLGKGPLGLGV